MHGYCSKCGYMQSYASIDAGLFYAILCKFLHILHFTPTDAIALRQLIKLSKKPNSV